MAGGKKNPIIVAQIMGKMNGGGVEAVIMNYYRHIDRTKVQFDFICDEDSTNIPYEEIEKLGGHVILCPPYQKIHKYMKFLENLFREKKYRIVHSNINTLSVFPLKAAKKAGVPIRIAHAHATTNKKELIRNLIKQILKHFSRKNANVFMCCSENAGRFQFGDKYYKSVFLLKNAIDTNKFSFDEKIRNEYRNKLGVSSDELVIGNVGRFVKTKNQIFLIDIFAELLKEEQNARLVLIGSGPDEPIIKKHIFDKKIENAVILLGQRDDIEKWYQAFDVYVSPSLYEGFGLSLLEAQATDCPCVASDFISHDVALDEEKIVFLSLSDNDEKWVKAILNKKKSDIRSDNKEAIKKAGFDINDAVNVMTGIYFEKAGESICRQ